MQNFPQEELDFLMNKQIWPLKQQISSKLFQVLEKLRDDLEITIGTHMGLPPFLQSCTPKISKGENYNSFPYLVLDYPRAFEKRSYFLFRSMILWGNHYSFHLILSGKFLPYFPSDINQLQNTIHPQMKFAKQSDPWRWESDEPGLVSIDSLNDNMIQTQKLENNFLKFSVFFPLKDVASLPSLGTSIWANWQNLL